MAFLRRSSKFLKRYINFKTDSKCEFDAPENLNFMSHPWIHIQLLNLETAMSMSQLDIALELSSKLCLVMLACTI